MQRLPNHPGVADTHDAAQDAWETLTALAATVTDEELATLDAPALLRRLFHDYSCTLQPGKTLQYKCTCDRERTDNTLMMLGKEDLTALLIERGEITVDCEFCGMRHGYQQADVDRVVDRIDTLKEASEAVCCIDLGTQSRFTQRYATYAQISCILDTATPA